MSTSIHIALAASALLSAIVFCTFSGARADKLSPDAVTIQVYPDSNSGQISPDFIGLGYETSAAAQTDFFSAKNVKMIQLYRNLSHRGLIRIGGNVSDHTVYVPNGASTPNSEGGVTIINNKSLVDLGDFARATGWKVMWGLNSGTGTKEEAAVEAAAVSSALQDRLQSFQIGNEVDLHREFGGKYDAYYSSYRDYKAALRTALPDAPISGPDCAHDIDWAAQFAKDEGSDIKLLTCHYYRGGAGSKEANLATLLKNDDSLDADLSTLNIVSQTSGVPYRINETNSYWGGGQLGVSDTFGSALWCLDYMFKLASNGCSGVNIETDINQLGFISHYSPIVHDDAGNCSVQPDYYAMLAFAMSGQGNLIKVDLTKDDINLTSYASSDDSGSIWVTVINKDLSRDAKVNVTLPDGYRSGKAYWLTAPSVGSLDDVTLAGSEVNDSGTWSPKSIENLKIENGSTSVLVAHASAVLLHLSGR